jgi:hypothetical protein
MTPKPKILSRHKLTKSIATGATVIVLAGGGSAVANSGSSSSANAGTKVAQVPVNLSPETDTIITGAAASKAKAE